MMGILFTAEEKKAAYHRIVNGNRAMGDAMLSHIMSKRIGSVNNCRSINKKLGNRAETAYRLVERGLIVTRSAFYEKTNILLGDK